MNATLVRKPLGQLLIGKGILRPDQLDRALAEQKRTNHEKLLGELLVELRFCTEDQIVETLAQTYGVPFARISPRVADPNVVDILPRLFLEKHQILPLFLVEGVLTVAVPEPANVFLIEEIERLSGHRIQVVAAMTRDIKATLQSYQADDKVYIAEDFVDEAQPEAFNVIEAPSNETWSFENAPSDLQAISLLNTILYNAIMEGASDIHIEPGDQTPRVRYRIDGRLVERLRPPLQMQAALASRIKLMAKLDADERRLPKDGAIRVLLNQRAIDLGISTMPGKSGDTIVIRVTDTDKTAFNLEKLGFSYDVLKQWRKLLSLPSGIVLVVGPAGVGKSTTLAASVQELNHPDVNICTVEDPIEHLLNGINQFQVDEKTGFTFSAALGGSLRQDADILMVGEIRDAETARLATQAALTGRLLLAGMHTSDAAGAIARLFNLGIEPHLVGSTLGGVLSQRLVRKLCQSCKESYTPTLSDCRQLESFGEVPDALYRAKGCPRCRNAGYSGRIGIFELLVPDDELIDLISRGASLSQLREFTRAKHLKPLRADGTDKVRAGITTLEEVHRIAN